MSSLRTRWWSNPVCSAILLTCLSSGCSGGKDDKWTENRPAVFPVQGKVIYKGEPLAGAMVSFRSRGSEPIVGASGMTDEDGEFRLTTYTPGDGAVAGEHQVTVVKAVVEGEDLSYYDQDSPNYGKDAPPTKLKHLIPEQYSAFETSNLTATVESSGANEIAIEVKE